MKDKFFPILLNGSRKFLRVLDKLKLPTKNLYAGYYKLILKVLNPSLKKAYLNYKDHCLKESSVEDIIWVMWWQGLDVAPKIVKYNVTRLQDVFGKERVIIITKDNYRKYTNVSSELVRKLDQGEITFTLWSDIIRYNLLMNNGGLWVDSTVIVAKNFLRDYKEKIQCDFFSLSNQKKDYRFISYGKWTGWFIGGKRGLSLFKFVTNFFEEYFSDHKTQYDYYLVDDAVRYFYVHNEEFSKLVQSISESWDPYLFIRNMDSLDVEKLFYEFNFDNRFYIQKFTYKFNVNETIDKKSLLGKLLDDQKNI